MNTREIINQSYKTSDGTKFTVLSAESYPASKVSAHYKPILDFKPGMLVAVKFHSALIPNITMDGGVARLTEVQIGDEIFDRPHAISKAIGIKDSMTAYPLRKV